MTDLARYGQSFKDKAVARLLPPGSAALDVVSQEMGIGVGTLERWRAGGLARGCARLEAVITTAAMNEADKSAWCRERGVYPAELDKWRANCTTALADPEDERASSQATRAHRQRIKEFERVLLRKDRALAETAAWLVLSKKVVSILNNGEDE